MVSDPDRFDIPVCVDIGLLLIVLPTTAWVLERERKSDEGVMKS